MNVLDFPIPRILVEEQLQRILLSKRFINATNPADFLRFVVLRKLDGKQSPGRLIAAELFGGKHTQGISSDVRVTASNLRKTLDRYYVNEGMGDYVRISFPQPPDDRSIAVAEGEPYTPIFEVNPLNEVYAGLAGAYSLLARTTYRDWQMALKIFDAIAAENPQQMGAQLGLIEALCNFKRAGWKNPQDAPIEAYCNQTFDSLKATGETYWRYWAVRGFYESLYGVPKATDAYRRALSLDKRKTEDYVEYINFMITVGYHDIAALLAIRWFTQRAGDSVSLVKVAMLFFRMEMSDQGVTALDSALLLDSANPGAHQQLAAVAVGRADAQAVAKHIGRCQLLQDEESLSYFITDLRTSAASVSKQDWLERILASCLSRSLD